MYNLRYHIVTIVSVFSALAIGLILGGLIVNKAPITSGGIVTDLKSEFSTLRSENKALTEDISSYEVFSKDLVADAVSGKLDGKTYVVLGLNNRAATFAKDDLEAAGAKVVSVTVKSDALDMTSTESPASMAITKIMTENSFSDPYDAIGLGLAGEWAKGASGVKPFTETLISQGVLTIKGASAVASTDTDTVQPIGGTDGVVNVAAVSGKADELSLAITRQFPRNSFTTATASLFHGSTDPATKSWEQGISATTMLGSPIGTYSLVGLMAGAEPGLYGSGAGIKALMPKMPTGPEVPSVTPPSTEPAPKP